MALGDAGVRELPAKETLATERRTYLHERGVEAALLERLVDCWASLFGERVISYRASRGLTDEPTITVVVQELVASERAGVMFTADPSTGNREHIVIEGAFGLGEVVVAGEVEPDTYLLDKAGPHLLEVRIGHKDHKLVAEGDGVTRIDVSEQDARRRVLTDGDAVELSKLGLRIEAHYGTPQDIEWAFTTAGDVRIVQSRPITTLTDDAPTSGEDLASSGHGTVLL